MVEWIVDIQVTDVAARRFRVIAMRTEGEEVLTYQLRSVQQKAGELLADLKLRIEGDLWAQYEADVTRRSQIALLVGSAEIDIATALNAREIA